MAKIENLNRLNDKLSKMERKSIADDRICCVVGYTANYALYVHENMEIWPPGMRLKGLPRPKGRGFYWDPQGQAQPKFLEAPARMFAREIGEIARKVYASTKNTGQALYAAGLNLQKESMRLVPTDTGNLKASVFTRLEELP